MRRYAFLLTLAIIIMSSMAQAQSRQPRGNQPNTQGSQQINTKIEKWNDFGDAEKLRRQRIREELKNLNEATDELLAAVRTEGNGKEVARLAEKIAKSAHRLRADYTNGESDEKVEPAAVADRSAGRVQTLAELIGKLVDNVFESRPESRTTFSVKKFTESIEHLKTLESHALALRVLAKH